MFTRLEHLFHKYTKRLADGSSVTTQLIEKEWREIAERHHIDYSHIYPSSFKKGVLTVMAPSLEEAAYVRQKKGVIIKELNIHLPQSPIIDILFDTHKI